MARGLVVAVLAAAACAAAVAQCPADPYPAGLHTVHLEVDGLDREFLFYVPRTYNASAPGPLVVNFHGYLSNDAEYNALTGTTAVAEEEGFLAILPQGYLTSWNGGDCCGPAAREGLDDVAFARAVVAWAHTAACVDPSRVFAAGFSNGNFFSYRLACEAADLFRAVGGVAGILSSEETFSCRNQTRYVPFMHLHGTIDPVIRFSDGREGFERYISPDISNCVDLPEVTFLNGSVTCETWDQCNGGIVATFCTIAGQGHQWPGCFDGCRGATEDINATRELWSFFRRVAGF